jgi:hypothetical protein
MFIHDPTAQDDLTERVEGGRVTTEMLVVA